MELVPTSVQIGAFVFNVDLDQAYMDREAARRGEELSGMSEFEKQKITIAEGQGSDITADTVLHEILHMCLRVTVCDINTETANGGVEDIEERMISALTGVLLDTLRRNPEMSQYLLGKQVL